MVELLLTSLVSPFVLKLKSWMLPVMLILVSSVSLWGSSGMMLSTLEADSMGVLLMSLTAGVVALMMVYESSVKKGLGQEVLFFLLLVSLSMCFITMSAIHFYIWFEFSLIPMAVLILGWGAQPERLLASLYMLFYTISASLPLLFLILAHSNFWFFGMSALVETDLAKAIVALGLSASFLVKFPMYLVHLWLPKAHVEAPCTGSMFLAGVLLKLGGFGIYRFNSLLTSSYLGVLLSLSLAGAGVAGFITLIQNDLKSLIAYSSIVHMGMIISSLVLKSAVGLMGAFWMMVAHGFCSSALFCIGTMVYERASTRNLLICQGLLGLAPGLGFFWALALLMNASAPPSLNLFSEVLMIWSCTSLRVELFLPIGIILFVSLAYGLYLYSKTFAGLGMDVEATSGGSVKEYFLSMSHLSWLFLAPTYVFMWLSMAKGS